MQQPQLDRFRSIVNDALHSSDSRSDDEESEKEQHQSADSPNEDNDSNASDISTENNNKNNDNHKKKKKKKNSKITCNLTLDCKFDSWPTSVCLTTYFTPKQVVNCKMSPKPIINTILRQLNFNIDNYQWIQVYNIFKKDDKKKGKGKGKKKNEAIPYDFTFEKPHTGQKHWTGKMRFRFTTISHWADTKNKNGTFPSDYTDLQFLPPYEPEPNDNFDIDVGIKNGDLSTFDVISDDQDLHINNEEKRNTANPYVINSSNNLSTEQNVDQNMNTNQNISRSINVNRQVNINSNPIPQITITAPIPDLPPIQTYLRSNTINIETNPTDNDNDNDYMQMNIQSLVLKYPWVKSKTLKLKTIEDFSKFLISVNLANALQKDMSRNKLSFICLYGSSASLRNINRLVIAIIEYNQKQTNNGEKIFLSELQQKSLTEIYSQYFPDPKGQTVTISDVIKGVKNDGKKCFNWPKTFDTSISLSLDTIASNQNIITDKYIYETKPKIKQRIKIYEYYQTLSKQEKQKN